MRVTVMKRNGGYYTTFEGDMRVSKNHRGDKWFVIKDLSDEEIALYESDKNWDGKDYVCHEFNVDEFYLILD